ncbi:MAG: COX15/CtaA family protein [Rhodocyclaceae bacterium]|nr:COX15/CtaA family protein [Rhodocyclaceae bacterium]
MSAPRDLADRRRVARWLFVCAALVWLTLVVGGVTRLTQSGLSIVEWQPVLGAVPPLDAAQWQERFAQYRQTPEYRLVNAGMSLDAFKRIYAWEYAHRLLGRVVGVVFLLPFCWFLWRRRLDGGLAARLLGIFVLGGLQGALGWYMVKSGLVADPRVSQYRLAAHLALAFLIFGASLWIALGLTAPRRRAAANAALMRLRRGGAALMLLALVMVGSGGFVAGIHAGKAYNSFPLMAGHVVPPEILMLEPWYLNFFGNSATVQFDHRLGAWLLAGLVPWFVWRLQGVAVSARVRQAARLLLAALALQIALGIATLLLAVPVALGAAHQGGAMVFFGALLWLNHELRVAG